MLAALCCVATMIIKIPSPLKSYLNLGDCVVLLSGWFLGSAYGFAPSVVNIPANAAQGVAGIILAKIFDKSIGNHL